MSDMALLIGWALVAITLLGYILVLGCLMLAKWIDAHEWPWEHHRR